MPSDHNAGHYHAAVECEACKLEECERIIEWLRDFPLGDFPEVTALRTDLQAADETVLSLVGERDALRAERDAYKRQATIHQQAKMQALAEVDSKGDTIFGLRDESQRLRSERDHARKSSKRWREVADGLGGALISEHGLDCSIDALIAYRASSGERLPFELDGSRAAGPDEWVGERSASFSAEHPDTSAHGSGEHAPPNEHVGDQMGIHGDEIDTERS